MQDFVTVCSYIAMAVAKYVPEIKKVFKKSSNTEAENEVINELKDENSNKRSEVTKGLLLELFKKTNQENKFHFQGISISFISIFL